MIQTLWTAEDAAAATGGEARGWTAVMGVSIDTREMSPGDLFVALDGVSHDGHVYVADALAKGAGAAMVSHIPDGVAEDAPLLIVDDTLEGLRGLGAAARARTAAKVIGVTGSVGKTSTKDMLRVMMSAQGRTHAAVRSFNNHWGVPLTLARMPPDSEFAVIEMGMNNAGEIVPLSKLARPHVALITTVEAVHLENLGTVEAIADAKGEIFTGLESGGIAVLNADNPYFDRLAAQAPGEIRSFGRASDDYKLIAAETAALSTIVKAQIEGQPVVFKLATPGVHFARNAVGALASLAAAGGDIARAVIALASWSPPLGRGARVRIAIGPGGTDGHLTLLDESYNANPAAVGAALSVLAQSETEDDRGRVSRGRRIAILGDMLELGPSEMAMHAALADLPALEKIDRVHCCGPRMRALYDVLPRDKRGTWAGDSEELAVAVRKLVDAGDVCMVKGSLGAKMAVVVHAIKGLGVVETQHVDGDA